MSKRTEFNDLVPLSDAVDELVASGRVRSTEGTLVRAAAMGRLKLFVEIRTGARGIKVQPERVAHILCGKAASEDLEARVSRVREGVYEFILPNPDVAGQAYFFPIKGPLIRDREDGSVYQLQQRRIWEASWDEDEAPLRAASRHAWLDETDPAKYCSADHWPDGCALCVLRSDLDEFLSAAAPGVRKPVDPSGKEPTGEPPQAAVLAVVQGDVQPALTTDRICEAFSGIGMTSLQWRVQLTKNRPKWLMRCQVDKGQRGASSAPATWNPLGIAAALVGCESRQAVTGAQLDDAFRRPLLRAFAADWRALRDDHPTWGE
jgi:hypothetical protein